MPQVNQVSWIYVAFKFIFLFLTIFFYFSFFHLSNNTALFRNFSYFNFKSLI